MKKAENATTADTSATTIAILRAFGQVKILSLAEIGVLSRDDAEDDALEWEDRLERK